MKKKVLSILLYLCIVVGMLPVIIPSGQAYSTGDNYPYHVAAGIYLVDDWGFYKGECTSFVAHCLNTRNGYYFTNTMFGWDETNKWGHAKHWASVARLHNISVDSNPTVGSVAWSSSGDYGHVAWVSAVNGNLITIEEYNYASVLINGEWHGNHLFRTRVNIDKSAFSGYIHFPMNGSTTPSQPAPSLPAQNLGSDFYAYIYNPNSNCNLENRDSNVQTARISTKDPRQIWHFYRQDQNLYKIVNMYDGRCLDAANYGTTAGTNIQACLDTGATAQRWWFCGEATGNRYYVHPLYIGDQSLVLDVNGGSTSPGANIQLWNNHYQTNGGTFDEKYILAQTFQVNKISNINSVLAHDMGTNFYSRIAYNGTYLQTTGTASGTSQDVCLTRALKDDPHQIWYFERQSNGSYKITNADNGWVLDVQGGLAQNRQKVQTWYNDNIGVLESKRWYCVYSPGDSTYRIVSALRYPNELYSLDIPFESTAEGTGVELFQQGFGDNQKFSIAAISYTKPSTKPAAPANVRVNATSSGTTISWDKPAGQPNGVVYTVIVLSASTEQFLYETVNGTSCSSSVVLPAGEYQVFIQASLNGTDSDPFRQSFTVQPKTCNIRLTASPSGGGTVSGGGTYKSGTTLTVVAAAKSGYRFVNWTENGNKVSSSASYPFTVSKDRTLTAVFEQAQTPPEDCEHNYVSTVIPPTCTEQGCTTQTCSKCGDSYTDRYTAALGHRYGQWVVTTPATAATDGSRERTCSRCGVKETSVIPATGSPLHGAIAISAGVFSPADRSLVAAGQQITLQATPDPGYRLTSLQVIDASGKSLQLSGSGNTYTFKMPSCDVTVRPVFSKT